ncbi:MAG: pilus assembly protein [Bdellovibrionales bacterium]|nr:pilus assembly protein [Bdellovibrionales bacterium]
MSCSRLWNAQFNSLAPMVAEQSSIPHEADRGSTIVEFAIVSLVFFSLIVIGAELLRLSYTNITLQFAASRALRLAVIGPPEAAPADYDHTTHVKDYFLELTSGLGISVPPESIRICASPNLNCSTDDSGNGGELIAIRATHTIELVLWHTTYTVSALAVGRNERFD